MTLPSLPPSGASTLARAGPSTRRHLDLLDHGAVRPLETHVQARSGRLPLRHLRGRLPAEAFPGSLEDQVGHAPDGEWSQAAVRALRRTRPSRRSPPGRHVSNPLHSRFVRQSYGRPMPPKQHARACLIFWMVGRPLNIFKATLLFYSCC